VEKGEEKGELMALAHETCRKKEGEAEGPLSPKNLLVEKKMGFSLHLFGKKKK